MPPRFEGSLYKGIRNKSFVYRTDDNRVTTELKGLNIGIKAVCYKPYKSPGDVCRVWLTKGKQDPSPQRLIEEINENEPHFTWEKK